MNTRLLVIIGFLSLLLCSCKKNVETSEESMYSKAVLDIQVDYEKQAGHGSNQWAVWIEDEDGFLVRTLYVTAFTADGGYIPRPACTPIWVGKARPDEMPSNRIDAISGATPQSGVQTYTWDLTDEDEMAVGNGIYTFVVEATLFGDSEVIFRAPIEIGKKESTVTANPVFTSEDKKNNGMIKSVVAHYKLVK